MGRWIASYAAVLCLVSFGCAQNTVARQEVKSVEVPRCTDAEDVGRFLAGIEGRPESPLKDLESHSAWKWHTKDLERMSALFVKERQPALREFQNKELSGKAFGSSTLFYPFGGPDVLTALNFFPDKKTYVLVGLEPPGTLPDSEAIRTADLDKYLARIRRTVDSILRRSFFITANMDVQVRGQITDGLLPLMLVQLARSDCEVLGHLPVTLDGKGRLASRKDGKQPPSSLRNDGVAIDFRCGEATAPVQRMIYFSVNLRDDAIGKDQAFQAFLASLQPVSTFFKSASYLPHRKEFSTIRELALKNSSAILEDDTGIPYRFFDRTQWAVRLYGGYSKPYGSYRNMAQKDLREAYQEGTPRPLGFFMGYGFGRIPSTLLVFERKKPKG